MAENHGYFKPLKGFLGGTGLVVVGAAPGQAMTRL